MTAPLPMPPPAEERTRRIEELIARCQAIADESLRADMQDLMRLILDWHGEALAHLMRAAAEAPHLEAALAAWARDGEVTALCELHGVVLPHRQPPTAGGLISIEPLRPRSS